MNTEKMNSHIHALQEKHDTLDKQIAHMEQIGSYEDADISHLKKLRLSLSDEILVTQGELLSHPRS